MRGRFAVIIVAACGGGLPTLPGANGSALSIKVTAREGASTGLAGATGYAEYADGTNELVTADEGGVLSFASTSVGAGVTSLSVGASGRIVRSIVAPDVSKYEKDGLWLELYDETAQPTATLSGVVKNMANPGDNVELGPSVLTQTDELLATSKYSFILPQNLPFTIVGLDVTAAVTTGRDRTYDVAKWFHIDFDALAGDKSFDIDVGAQAADPVTSVSNKLMVPDPTGAFGSTCVGDVNVYALDPTKRMLTPVVGAARLVSLSSDKTFFAFEVDYITISNGPFFTLAYLYEGDGSFSMRILAGAPSTDTPIDGLRVPLKLGEKTVSAGDVLDATGAVDPVAFVVSTSDDNPVWRVDLDSGSQLRIPILPDPLKSMLAAPGPYQGTLETCVRTPDDDPMLPGHCVVRTGSTPAVVKP